MQTIASLFWSVLLLAIVVRVLLGIVGISEGVKFLDRAIAVLLFAALVVPLAEGALRQAAGALTAPRTAAQAVAAGPSITEATGIVAGVVVVGNVLFLGFVLRLRRRLAARRDERERTLRGRERVAPRVDEGGR